MTQIEGGHIDDRVGAVPGPDSVNRRVSGPGTEPGSVPGLARLNWAICKRGYRVTLISAIKTIISVSPNWRKVLKQFRQTEVRCAYGEIGDRQR